MKKIFKHKTSGFSIFKKVKSFFIELDLIYLASDLRAKMGLKNTSEVDEMLRGAMLMCAAEDVSIEGNFKLIYRYTNDGIVVDYKLSAFAYKLIYLNSEQVFQMR